MLQRYPWVLMHEAPRGQEGFELTARARRGAKQAR